MNTPNDESKNIISLDHEAEDLIYLLEYLSPRMVTHDGTSAPRQYYEKIKKKSGRSVAIATLKVLISNLEASKLQVEQEFSKKIKEETCAKKKKSQKGHSQK